MLGTKTCTVAASIFATPDFGTPGNADFNFAIVPEGNELVAAIFCGGGFEF